jgi:hypothetical protein
MPPVAIRSVLTPAHPARPLPSEVVHDPPQSPAVLVGDRNAEVSRQQLMRRDPLLAADVRPGYAG